MSIDWDIDTISDPDVEISHTRALREIKHEKRPGGEMFRAALYTYRVCYVTRTVGRGGPMTYQDFAEELGYSKGYITALRRLGRALVIHRVPPDSALYTVLATHSGRKEIGRLLEREPPLSLAQLHDAVAQLQLSTDRRSALTPSPEVTFEHAFEALESLVQSHPDLEVLLALEERAGDLHFALRQARKARHDAT